MYEKKGLAVKGILSRHLIVETMLTFARLKIFVSTYLDLVVRISISLLRIFI